MKLVNNTDEEYMICFSCGKEFLDSTPFEDVIALVPKVIMGLHNNWMNTGTDHDEVFHYGVVNVCPFCYIQVNHPEWIDFI